MKGIDTADCIVSADCIVCRNGVSPMKGIDTRLETYNKQHFCWVEME